MQTRGEVARAKILQEASRAFARFGYDGTRLDKVAETLGLTRQALLFHFKDKRGLYDAALESVLAQREEELDSRREFGQLADYVDYLVEYSVDFYLENPEYMRLMLRLLMGEGPVATEAPAAGKAMVGRWEEVIEEGVENGVTHTVAASSLVAVIGGTLSYYMMLPLGARSGGDLMNYDPQGANEVAQIKADLQRAVRGLLGLEQA